MATSYLFVWLMLSLLTFATRQTDLMLEGRMWVWIYILAKIPGPVPAKLLALPTLKFKKYWFQLGPNRPPYLVGSYCTGTI